MENTKSKIRFLACSDLHSNLDLVSKISKDVNFENIDFVLFNGDLSDMPDDFSDMLKPFLENKKEIFMVPGNHETNFGVDNLKDFYDVKLVGDEPIVFGDDLAIFGTNYMEIGMNSYDNQFIFDNMVSNFEKVKNCKFKIQMNHIPARGTKLGDASPYPFVKGSIPLKKFLKSDKFCPDVCLVGHIHETSGLEEIVNKTKVINLAETFKIFEFDLNKKELIEVKK